jgi:hypothetical protein
LTISSVIYSKRALWKEPQIRNMIRKKNDKT